MALVSFEQRRQRERADEQASKILQELAEYDLAHSTCPVDRRRAEMEAERKAQEARDAEQSQRTQSWVAWIDQRILEHIKRARQSVIESTTEVVGQSRVELHEEFKRALDEKKLAFEARLAALEQGSNDRWAVVDQRVDQSIERAREPLLQGTNEVLGRFRDELKEYRRALDEKERAFDVKLAELEHRLKSSPGKLPIAKTWRAETVAYQADFASHNGRFIRRDETPGRSPDAALIGFASRVRAKTGGRQPSVANSTRVSNTTGSISSPLTALRLLLCVTSRRLSRHRLGGSDSAGADGKPWRDRPARSARIERREGRQRRLSVGGS